MEEASAPRSEGPDARERILRAATELIASDGIDEVRIARVANRARASTALVHHYFSTREELLAQALLQSFELAADERFVASPAAAASATEGLAIAIERVPADPGGGGARVGPLGRALAARGREPELRPVAGPHVRELPGVGCAGDPARGGERRVPREVGPGCRSRIWRWRCSTDSACAR